MAIERRPTQQDLSWFLDLHRQNRLNLNPPYQRKSVWNMKDKRFFLDTVFNNYPCPAIYLQKETDKHYQTTYNVVDGKQRLTTVMDFYDNKIRLSHNFGDIRLDDKKWSEIDDDSIKRHFLDYTFTVDTLSSIDYKGWNIVFDRLNRNSSKLSDQELRHARFNGWLITRAEQEAEEPLWKEIKISSTSKARRMKDVEFISILMLVILEERIVGFPQSALDELYAKYEDIEDISELGESFDLGEFQAKFKKIKEFISNLNKDSDILTENKTFGAKRTTHLYTLWSYLALKKIPRDISIFKEKYKEFFEIIESLKTTDEASWNSIKLEDSKKKLAISYYTNATGPTTEEPQRKERLEALAEFLEA